MDKDCSNGQMEEFTLDCSQRARKTERVCTTGPRAKFMKVNSKMTNVQVRVRFTTRTVKFSLVCGRRARSTEKAITNGLTVQSTT